MPDLRGERVHFVGVGGASMCALAEYCLLAGAEVSGSDRVLSAATERLAALGAQVYRGVRRDIIARAGLVVRSSAVPLTDEEVALALALGKRVTERHEFLAAVAEDFRTVAAVAGTHGKTTVTAMTAHILKECGMSFVAHIGGTPVGMGNLTVCGGSGELPRELFLTEACEFGRHLTALSPDIAAVVNMECDHPDCYRDIGEVHETFAKFVENCPYVIVREGDEIICTGAHITIGEKCSHMKECAYLFSSVPKCGGGQTVTVSSADGTDTFTLPYAGAHYAEDGTFAVALAVALGADMHRACAALSRFKGVTRRCERAGRMCGAEVIFDYAHHPTELACTLDAAEADGSRVLPVFQPHTYTRTASYLDAFAEVLGARGEVILLPVYAARERAKAGGTSRDLAFAVERLFPECKVHLAVSLDDAWNIALSRAGEYDKVLFLGAGDIYDLKAGVRGSDDVGG